MPGSDPQGASRGILHGFRQLPGTPGEADESAPSTAGVAMGASNIAQSVGCAPSLGLRTASDLRPGRSHPLLVREHTGRWRYHL